MADINVERGGPTIWPWVLGLLVLALLVWGLAEIFGGDPDSAESVPLTDSIEIEAPQAPPPPMPAAPAPARTGPDTLGGMADTLF